jgi:nicotinamidase-related amidase
MKSMKGLLSVDDCVLVVIDIQEKLMPVIHQADLVFSNTQKLIDGFTILQTPIVATEQYPKGLGKTCSEIVLPEQTTIIEKTSFSCLGEDLFHPMVKQKRSLVLCGVETHICVLKTALDAVRAGFEIHVVTDATSSRNAGNKEMALVRMQQSGIFMTTMESVLFQLMDCAGTDQFKAISRLIK